MVTFLVSKLMLQLGLKLHLRLSCLFSVHPFFTTEDKKKIQKKTLSLLLGEILRTQTNVVR